MQIKDQMVVHRSKSTGYCIGLQINGLRVHIRFQALSISVPMCCMAQYTWHPSFVQKEEDIF